MRRASPFLSLAVILGVILGSTLWLARPATTQTPRPLQWRRAGEVIREDVASMASLGTDLFAGTTGGIFRSRDRGVTWGEKINNLSTLPVPVFRNFPLVVSGTRLLVRAAADSNGNSGSVYYSDDRGQSWRLSNLGSPLATAFGVNGNILVTQLVPETPVNGRSYLFYRSMDGGQSWQERGNKFFSARAFAYQGTTLFAGMQYPGGLQRSNDHGETWEVTAVGMAPKAIMKLAATDTTLIAYVTNSGSFSPIDVEISTNAGQSFSRIEDLPAGNIVRDFAVSGTLVFAAIENRGVYFSSDSGRHWTPTSVNEGLTNLQLKALTISNGQVFVSAKAVGALESEIFVADIPSNCSYAIAPTNQTFGASGGTGSVAVSVGAGCAWMAESNATWLTVNGATSGTGNGTVAYTVASNTGPARTAALTIAGQTFTVTQAASCAYTLTPTSQSFGANGGTGTVQVATGNGCAWTAVSNEAWLTITSGASSNGSSSVGYNVAPNTGSARTGTLTIAGQTFTLTQGNGCAYTLTATSQSFSSNGGLSTVQVTTSNGCTWTAASNDPWLTITSGASQSGAGTVGYSVAPNTGTGARAGTLTIANQTFSVTQTGTTPNPTPVLSGLNPSVVLAGSETFTLELNGSNFVNGSTVRWNGSERITAFINSTRLTAAISAADVTLARGVEITVFTPAPGGGASNALFLQINNPAPAITSLSPSSVTVGSPGLTLAINGVNFVNGALVRWNGADRTTNFVSRALLTVALTSTDFATAGTANVEVFNPAPGGGISNLSTLTITPAAPLCPVFGTLNPLSSPVGTRVTITGTNFSGITQVKFTGNIPAQFTPVGDTQLTVIVPAGALSGPIMLSKPNCGEVLTASFTVPSTITISGTVTYGLGTGAPVTGVVLTATNLITADKSPATSLMDGRYALTNLVPGSYEVTLEKSGEVNGLSALDAVRILRRLKQLESFNLAQELAADVNRDGILSEADASALLRQLVGLSESGQAGNWRFTPGQRRYVGVQNNVPDQDYQAILIGEVTGNWRPGVSASLSITSVEAPTAAAPGWLIRGAQFQPGLTLIVWLPTGGEWRLSGPQLQDLTEAAFRAPLGLAVPGLWTLQVVNADGQATPPFSFLWPTVR